MGLVLTTVTGLTVWVVLWALGVSGFDAFLPVVVLVLFSVAVSNIRPANRAPGGVPPMSVNYAANQERRMTTKADRLIRVLWGVAGFLILVGFGVWLAAVVIGHDLPGRLSDLGSALLGGAVVAFSVVVLQQQLDERADRQRHGFEAHAESERRAFELHAESERRAFEAALEAQNLRLVVGLQVDLTKADLSRVDLSRAVFNRKTLTEAVFEKATLTGAVFVSAELRKAVFLHATLIDTQFVGADLTDAKFSFADLKGAVFLGADVTKAVFTDVINIGDADFRGAYYRDDEPPEFDGPLPDGITPRR